MIQHLLLSAENIASARRAFPEYHFYSNSSLVARHAISQYLEVAYDIPHFFPEKDVFQHPEKEIYWSMSYTESHIVIAVEDHKIGVDIEHIVPRDPSLFSYISEEEWKILGEKTWENFYLLWTGKEAIIKKKSRSLNDLKEIICTGKTDTHCIFSFRGEKFISEYFKQDDFLTSLA